jgi:uncharacterized protein (DUF885 family)
VQLAERAHGPRGNPALWSGEAVFSVIALMIRDYAPLGARMRSAEARLRAVPTFLAGAERTLAERAMPAAWSARTLADCEGAAWLLRDGLDAWLGAAVASEARLADRAAAVRAAAEGAAAAFARFADWVRARPAAPDSATACGGRYHDLLLARGHHCTRPRAELHAEARAGLDEARARLGEMARAEGGTWPELQARIADDHPAPDDYLPAFARAWEACRARALECDVVTWPDWPIRYVPYPPWTRGAAPRLYYLHYRSPAPFDPYDVHDYVVPERPDLRAWNHAAIKLNHVVHHGGVGHHVQNWHAYHRAPTRVGRIAAVDCANRIGMLCGGTMAEGWACYATGLMEELGFLTPLERVAEQHSRVRFLARAVIDLALHERTMTFGGAVQLWMEAVGAGADAARGEVAKAAMFPGTAIMYWLGTREILDLRAAVARRRGAAFSLRAFHDDLLGQGSIPMPLVARLMTEGAP